MRRTASEIIRNLKSRVARLERQAQQKTAYAQYLRKDWLTTAYDDELQSFESLYSVLYPEKNRELMSLKVFLKCLSLKRANTVALKLSKKFNIKGWENDSKVLTYALMLKKHDTKGIGRVFTMIADTFYLNNLWNALKGARLLAPLYEVNDFMGLWNLILGSNGVSLEVLDDDVDVEIGDDRVIEEGEVGVANYGGADIYGDEIDLLREEEGEFTIPLGVNTNQFNEILVERLAEFLDDAIYDALNGKKSHPSLEDFDEWFLEGRDAKVSVSVDFDGNKIVGNYSFKYTETVNAEDYYSPY